MAEIAAEQNCGYPVLDVGFAPQPGRLASNLRLSFTWVNMRLRSQRGLVAIILALICAVGVSFAPTFAHAQALSKRLVL